MSVLIKNGRIITSDSDYYADVYTEGEKISLIGNELNVQADSVIDAKGKYVIPGGIDVHTHLDMPLGSITSSDNFESGTIAAAFGGTTSIIDFATQNRGTKILNALDEWHKKAEGKAVIDYGFHMIITELPYSDMTDLNTLINEGITSFKLFMAYPNSLMVNDDTVLRIMRYSADLGALVCMHAEDGQVIDQIVRQTLAEGKKSPIYHALTRPAVTERDAVYRTIKLAHLSEAPVYIVHLSCNDALEKIDEARNKGLPVFAETCPQYLFLSLEENMGKPGFEDAKYVFTPPLREKWNQEKLWSGLKRNSIQVVSTDHCPFYFKGQKELGIDDFTRIPNGVPGIEHRMQLLFHEGVNERRISLSRWVELTSTAPAKMFGMYPRKGSIAPGSDADIVIWDPIMNYTISAHSHHMCVDYSIYEGKAVQGNAEIVLSRGEVIIKDNEFKGKAGRGKFLKRNIFSSLNI